MDRARSGETRTHAGAAAQANVDTGTHHQIDGSQEAQGDRKNTAIRSKKPCSIQKIQ